MKKAVQIVLILAILALSLLLPFILSSVAGKGFQAGEDAYKLPDLLSYYGSVLVFIGTSSLAIISIIQNKRNQEKTDRVNELTLELQKKTMQFAEYQYNKDREKEEHYPDFEVTILSHQGDLTGCKMTLKNTSAITAENIKSVELIAVDNGAFKKGEAKEVTFSVTTLSANETADIHTDLVLNRLPEECQLVWRFTCEIESGKTYYYTAYIEIPIQGAKPITEKVGRAG